MTLALHGATATIHDHVAGRKGDYDEMLTRLLRVNAAHVRTTVTRSNARSLAALAQWLLTRRQHVDSWSLQWPGPCGAGLAMPRLGIVAPRVLHAAELARRGGLRVTTRGLPACVLGPHVQHREPIAPRTYVQACEGCSARATCEGVPAQYTLTFARDLELRTLRAVTVPSATATPGPE